jgi:hypothetical protein
MKRGACCDTAGDATDAEMRARTTDRSIVVLEDRLSDIKLFTILFLRALATPLHQQLVAKETEDTNVDSTQVNGRGARVALGRRCLPMSLQLRRMPPGGFGLPFENTATRLSHGDI